MLQIDPNKRPSAGELLENNYFKNCNDESILL